MLRKMGEILKKFVLAKVLDNTIFLLLYVYIKCQLKKIGDISLEFLWSDKNES